MRVCASCGHELRSDGWRCRECDWQPGGEEIPLFAPDLLEGAGGDYPADAYADSQSFEGAAGYWYRPRGKMIAWALKRYFPEASSFFDSGCGAGPVLEAIRRNDGEIALTGADASLEGLTMARSRVPGLEILQAGAHQLPFREEFDAAGCFDVLEHLDDDLGALTELAATVRPGGGVLVTVPQHPRLWSAFDEAGGHKRRYQRSQLVSLFDRAGLEPVRVTSYVFSLLPLMAMSRKGPSDAADEQAGPGPTAAKVLERLLLAEVAAMRVGVSYPIGGSLFVVARKPDRGE